MTTIILIIGTKLIIYIAKYINGWKNMTNFSWKIFWTCKIYKIVGKILVQAYNNKTEKFDILINKDIITKQSLI